MTGFLGQGGVSPVPGGAQGNYPQYFGIFYGTVSNNSDPKKQNRCLLRVPMLLGGAVTTWAVSLTPLQNPPAVGTLVACMFVGGDLDNPCYMVINPKIVVESSAGNIKPIGTTSSAGTSTNLAAADHVHGNISTTLADIKPIGGAAAVGASGRVADAQHSHGTPDPLVVNDLTVTNTAQAGNINCTGTVVTVNMQVNGFLIGSVATPSTTSLNNDTNSGNYWVSGERAFLNGWVSAINQNFVNIIAALQSAGIFH